MKSCGSSVKKSGTSAVRLCGNWPCRSSYRFSAAAAITIWCKVRFFMVVDQALENTGQG